MRKAPPTSILERLMSRLRGRQPEPPAARALPPRPFQAISIYRGITSCKIARQFSNYRFLTKDAPRLPLAGCTMNGNCDCRYVKHGDRRGDLQRRMQFGISSTLFAGKERRRKGGRRVQD